MGTAVGTLEYMGPEQLMGGRADGRTDIYTVGVLAYEMITGRRPFNAAGLDLLTVQLTEPPPPPSSLADVPRVVDDILLRCLAHDTADRFADVDELARALDAAIACQPAPAATRAPAPMPVERPVFQPASARLETERVIRHGMSAGSRMMLLVSIVLFLIGAGLFVAYWNLG